MVLFSVRFISARNIQGILPAVERVIAQYV